MAQVSIIVPIYNCRTFLPRCVESILAQTERDLQLILVDDGSVDGSGDLCDAFAAKDPRVLVIHQENAGVSAARNAGLAAANGEYIGFVDGDDEIRPETYAEALSSCGACEVVMWDVITVYGDGRMEPDSIPLLEHDCKLQKADVSPELLLWMAGSACRCLYRADLIRRYQIQFDRTMKFSEDRVFNLYAMGYANKISHIKKGYYYRLVHDASAVHRFHADYYQAIKAAAKATDDALNAAWGADEALLTAYKQHFIGGAFGAINNYYYRTSTMSSKERREAVKVICQDPQLRSAIEQSGWGGIRSKWILKKRVRLLGLCATLLNKRYGR